MKLCRVHGLVLFLQLSAPLPLVPLDAITLSGREHLLILDSQLPPVELDTVHVVYDLLEFGSGEVGEGQAPKHASVEVVVEGVWEGRCISVMKLTSRSF